MARKTYKSKAQAETAKARAVRFVHDVVGDPDRASEIEEESLDSWLEETGRQIKNSRLRNRGTIMAKTTRDYVAEIRALKEERDTLADELEDANSRLEEIDEILGEPEDDEDED